jgi:hypothetical protein
VHRWRATQTLEDAMQCRFAAAAAAAAAAAVVLFTALPTVHAQCAYSVYNGHAVDGWFAGLPEATVTAREYAFGNPAINMGASDILCTEPSPGDTAQGNGCPGLTGYAAGDGLVMVDANWGNLGAVGCPTDACPPPGCGTGDAVIVLLLSGSFGEGSASHSAVYLLVSVGYEGAMGMFLIEAAHQVDASGTWFTPLDAHVLVPPAIASFDAVSGAVELAWTAATLDDDCSPTSVGGAMLGTCTDYPGAVRPTLGAYNVYRTQGPCSAPPATGAAAAWTFVGATTATTWTDTIAPASLPTGECAWYALGLGSGGLSTDWVSANSAPVSFPAPPECMAGAECDDAEPCTADACASGACTHAAAPDGTSCADGDACNGDEACAGGVCVPGAPPTCPAPGPCVGATCEAAGGCTSNPFQDGTACIDPSFGSGACGGGVCVPFTPPGCTAAWECDDAFACTTDSCDAAGMCLHALVSGCCAFDGDCAPGEVCTANACVGAAGTDAGMGGTDAGAGMSGTDAGAGGSDAGTSGSDASAQGSDASAQGSDASAEGSDASAEGSDAAIAPEPPAGACGCAVAAGEREDAEVPVALLLLLAMVAVRTTRRARGA